MVAPKRAYRSQLAKETNVRPIPLAQHIVGCLRRPIYGNRLGYRRRSHGDDYCRPALDTGSIQYCFLVWSKIKTVGKTGVIPSRRSLAACRPLGFLGRLRAPSRIGGQMGGDAWSGHVSWPTSLGRGTMSCCCGTSIWLLKTGF